MIFQVIFPFYGNVERLVYGSRSPPVVPPPVLTEFRLPFSVHNLYTCQNVILK